MSKAIYMQNSTNPTWQKNEQEKYTYMPIFGKESWRMTTFLKTLTI